MRLHLSLAFLVLALLLGCRREPTGFELRFEQAGTPENQKVQEFLQKTDLTPVLEGLNAAFRLPRLVPIVFKDGDEQAAYRDGEIVLCYDFFVELEKDLEKRYPDPDERRKILTGQAHFVLYHEVGHAMVDMLEIPVVGGEEDAVDGLATILAVSVLKRPELAIGAAVALDTQDDAERDLEQQDFWDNHSLNAQRYYNIICWVHGGAPEMCGDLVTRLVPADWFEKRGADCPEEFERLRKNWGKLLEPHFKPGVKLLVKAVRRAKEHEAGTH